ncbi:MAG: restriction endonuclease [Gammaproteobacteria bacterium]|nr:restriction endonuclease [Gammaproteobacteria bacterium]
MSNAAPVASVDHGAWLQVLRGITTATNERTLITTGLSSGGVGKSAPVVDYDTVPAVAAALVVANMNAIPLDWAARFSVGGVNMNFFIVKQLPVLLPEAYLEEARCGGSWVELVIPRVLELAYTGHELGGFASDLGYPEDRPFRWNDSRRHRLQSELDAIFSHLYQLDRTDVEWILDAPTPSSSFPSLKQHEIKEFDEYRTQRYVLEAFDQLSKGRDPSTMSLELK